ncbi:diablo IAP-binding mitochondrial protein-like isoform X2 [Asterias amurensis]|uniref:diablo IAP-binding mitochondrial protein-like isoform X2 n=1 Tax=Asterias amurensis TaxID=7602 RepID=UPI003AB7D8D6
MDRGSIINKNYIINISIILVEIILQDITSHTGLRVITGPVLTKESETWIQIQRRLTTKPPVNISQPSRTRSWLTRICGLGTFGSMVLCAMPISSKLSHTASVSLQDQSEALSHQSLIKSAAAITVDSSCVLLTHAALAAIALHKEYAKMVNHLKLLLKDHGQFIGGSAQEDVFWLEIIEMRVGIDDKMLEIEKINDMLTSAILVLERAAEAAFQADVELSAVTAGQHLQLVQSQLDMARKLSQKAQQDLTNIQVESIKQSAGEGGSGTAVEETAS